MLEVRNRQSVPKTANQAVIFSPRAVWSRVEEEIEQEVWNTRIGQASAGVTIEQLGWTRNAATAQASSFKSFMVEDAATEFRTLENNEDQVTDLICKIRFTRSIPDRESIAQRLFELLQDVKEEETESAGMSIWSLRSFYSFLQTYSNLKKPAIGLTPVNDIYVSLLQNP